VPLTEIIDDARRRMEALERVSSRIKGPRGTDVQIEVTRALDETGLERENLHFTVTRGKIPLQSIVEARKIQGDIGYLRVSDFKKNTAEDLRREIEALRDSGMSALILDLRWNPGGLLNAAREVSELFLPKGSLVTYTLGRPDARGGYLEDMKLYTEKRPVLPESFPVVLLVNNHSASSSEIVTGALQYYKRAIIIGQKTFGKGSVQTIIPLRQPEGSALRLTTALYYTPADVTIDQVGINPDIEIVMENEEQNELYRQLMESQLDSEYGALVLDHGAATGNMDEDAAQDPVLLKALEVLDESAVFGELVEKYHRPVSETQRMASKELQAQKIR